ncbi:TIGR03086 family protein [Streptomyces finlayi]|uniref:TIGR03086 family protein n=1 Tax=Streptomyces finlayi TaxID=67296 RepID=A0A7G7BVH1_9ACTN|nr:TIGR03086 family metal-binding protein [Streptomyces finlayi]QNE79336.1 TIGR03086 family protein [Streptomyces finlayi]
MQKMSELLAAARAQALPVVAGIDDERLGDPTPCSEYDVRALLNHLFHVVVNFQALAAKQPTDFGLTPDVVTGDWRGAFARETGQLVTAWDASGAEDGVAGAMGLPARTVGLMVLGDLTVHAWDLARATGQDFLPAGAAVDEAGPAFAALAPQAREGKMFGEPVPVPAGASAFEQLLALTGRDPGWRPPRV